MSRSRHSRRSIVEWSQRLESRQLLSGAGLDDTYGDTGVAVPDSSATTITTASPSLSARLSDSSLLIATKNEVFHVLTDGTYDPSFGNYSQPGYQTGVFKIPSSVDPGDFYITAMAVDSQDHIYLAINDGNSNGGYDKYTYLMKLTSSGRPVADYGNNGLLTHNFSNTKFEDIADIAIMANDAVLVLGVYVMNNNSSSYFLESFDSTGAHDPSFSTVTLSSSTTIGKNFWVDYPISLAVSDTYIYIGANHTGTPAIYRYFHDGTKDTTFGLSGKLEIPVIRYYITDMMLDSDSRLLVSAGYNTSSNANYHYGAIFRITEGGAQDMTFGAGGVAVADASDSATSIYSLGMLSDGSIMAGTYGHFNALHFSEDGVYDSSFVMFTERNDGIGERTGWTYGFYNEEDGRTLITGNYYTNAGYKPVAIRIEGTAVITPMAHLSVADSAGEDEAIALSATADAPPGRPVVAYQWDIDYNGEFFVADLSGAGSAIPAWTFNGPSSHVVALRVIDSSGALSAIVTKTLAITNAAPSAAVDLAYGTQTPIFINTGLTFDLTAFDAPGDVVSLWTVDWGDGNIETFNDQPTSAAHTYATAGSFTITATAMDNLNATSAAATASVVVYACPQIAGYVYYDRSANGVKNNGDSGISDVRVWLDDNGNGVFNNGEPTAITDANGYYLLVDLPLSTTAKFRVQTPDGYHNTSPMALSTGSLPANQTLTLNFALYDRTSISGRVFLDENGDNTYNPGEHLLGNIRLYFDSNNNGVFDKGEKSVLTDKKGKYTFNNIPAGRHRIRAVLPPTLKSLYHGTPRADWWINLAVSNTPYVRNFFFVD